MNKIIGLLKKVGLAFLVLVVIGAVFGGGNSKDKESSQSSEPVAEQQAATTESEATETPAETPAETPVEEPQPVVEEAPAIEYQNVSVDDLIAVLKNNPMNAKNTYEGAYIRLTGVLNNIDASGDYFSLNNGDQWSFDHILCYIKDDATLNRIASANMNDTLTVCGQVKSVGEILGYSMDVDYIE